MMITPLMICCQNGLMPMAIDRIAGVLGGRRRAAGEDAGEVGCGRAPVDGIVQHGAEELTSAHRLERRLGRIHADDRHEVPGIAEEPVRLERLDGSDGHVVVVREDELDGVAVLA